MLIWFYVLGSFDRKLPRSGSVLLHSVSCFLLLLLVTFIVKNAWRYAALFPHIIKFDCKNNCCMYFFIFSRLNLCSWSLLQSCFIIWIWIILTYKPSIIVLFRNKLQMHSKMKLEGRSGVLKWVTMYVLFSSIGVRECEGGGVNLIPILTQSMATLSKELYLWQLCQIRETTSPS